MAEPQSITLAELAADDAKIITLARAARARINAAEGAAVRDVHGRTYASATVALPSLRLSALQAVVAAAFASGVEELAAAAVVTASAETEVLGVDALRELGARATVFVTDPAASVVQRHTD